MLHLTLYDVSGGAQLLPVEISDEAQPDGPRLEDLRSSAFCTSVHLPELHARQGNVEERKGESRREISNHNHTNM